MPASVTPLPLHADKKLVRPEAVRAPFPDRQSLALARDQVQAETALAKLRQAMAAFDDLLVAGVQARRTARRLDAAIREALHLSRTGAEPSQVLFTLREALDE